MLDVIGPPGKIGTGNLVASESTHSNEFTDPWFVNTGVRPTKSVEVMAPYVPSASNPKRQGSSKRITR